MLVLHISNTVVVLDYILHKIRDNVYIVFDLIIFYHYACASRSCSKEQLKKRFGSLVYLR